MQCCTNINIKPPTKITDIERVLKEANQKLDEYEDKGDAMLKDENY